MVRKLKNSILDPIIFRDAEKYLLENGKKFDRVIIIGANGLLGSYLLNFISIVNEKLGNNLKPIGFARSTTPYLRELVENRQIEMFPVDKLETKLANLQNINVIHAASPASYFKVSKDVASLVESNIHLTDRIHSILEKTGGKFTYFSSGEIYGTSPKLPTSEADYSGFDHLSPHGIYAEIKRFTELKAKIWNERTGIPVTILRIFHTFGPGIDESDHRIFASIIYDLVNKKDIVLNSDGAARRSFLYSSDLAKAINVLGQNDGFEVFNVAGNNEITISDFAKMVSSHDVDSQVTYSQNMTNLTLPQSPIMRGFADTSKLKSFGWQPSTPIEEAILNTIESVKWRRSYNFQ
jgi:nucleoside-diphosphate-sugar epimerase